MLVFISCNTEGTAPGTGTDATATGAIRETREEDFVKDVAESNARLIPLLNAGVSNAKDQEVKANAEKMLSDHRALHEELEEYAQKNNITLPDADTTNAVDIREKPGTEWDEEWADEVGDDQMRLVNRFERANRMISDDDTALKNIVAKNLPKLQSHFNTAQKLEERLDRNN